MRLSPELTAKVLELAGASGVPFGAPDDSELEFTRSVIRLAQRHHWRVAHFRAVRVQRPDGRVYYETPVQGNGVGWPDLVLVRDTRVLAAELKVGRNKPSAEQRAWLAAFEAAGIPAYVWRPENWPSIEAILR